MWVRVCGGGATPPHVVKPLLHAFKPASPWSRIRAEPGWACRRASPSLARRANASATPYAISVSNAAGGSFNPSNYNLSYVNGALMVTPAPLTVTATNGSKVYGQTATLGYATTGLQNGDTLASVTETSAGAAATANASTTPYTINIGGATGGSFSAGNYNVTYVNGALTVTPAALTVTASNASKTYGQTAALGFTTSGLQNSDSISSVTETSAGAAATANASATPYVINIGGASGSSFTAGNYNITYANGALTVAPAALTVTANNASKTYGQTAALSYSTSGLQNGDTIGSVTEASAGAAATANVQTTPYPITIGGASGGSFVAGNYNVSYANGALTVTPAALAIIANNAAVTQGTTPSLTGFTAIGLQNGQTVGSVTETSPGTAANASVGTYAITPSNATGGSFSPSNYNVAYVNGVLSINGLGSTSDTSTSSSDTVVPAQLWSIVQAYANSLNYKSCKR